MSPSTNKLKRRKSVDSNGDDDSIYSNSSRKKARNNRKKKEKKNDEKENNIEKKNSSMSSSSIPEKNLPSSNGLHAARMDSDPPKNELDMILTFDVRKKLVECDYCRRDISQLPRIRCAVCADFDLCLDCFSTTDPSAANTNLSAAQAAKALSYDEQLQNEALNANIVSGKTTKKKKKGEAGYVSQHEASHGYRVADSTRFPLFPSIKTSNDRIEKDKSFVDNKPSKVEKGSKTKKPSNGKKLQIDSSNKEDSISTNKLDKDIIAKTEESSSANKSGDAVATKTKENPSTNTSEEDATAKIEEKTPTDKSDEKVTAVSEEKAPTDKSDEKLIASTEEKKLLDMSGVEATEKKTFINLSVQNNTAKTEVKVPAKKSDQKVSTKTKEKIEQVQTEDELKDESRIGDTLSGEKAISENAKESPETLDINSSRDANKCKEEDASKVIKTIKQDDSDINKNVERIEKKGKEQYMENVKNAWTVEEDLRLLDAISSLGLGNWADISEVVSGNNPSTNGSTKSAKRCMERYLDDYLGRYGHILPQYILVEVDEEKAEESKANDTNMNPHNIMQVKKKKSRRSDASIYSTHNTRQKRYRRILTSSLENYDDLWPEPYIPPIGVKNDDEVGRDTIVRTEKSYFNMISSANCTEEAKRLHREWMSKNKDNHFLKQSRKPVLPPRLDDIRLMQGSELAGYMPRRGDFDVEYDNDAEEILADMEFSSNDPPSERALKLQIIRIYNSKLDERERRKQFLKDWDLLDYKKNQMLEKKLPPDELDLIRRMRLFARFHTKGQHDEFLENLIKAQQLRKQISRLQFYRRMGITTLAEAEAYELDKRRRDHHKIAVSQREADERLKMLKDMNSCQNASRGISRQDRSRKRRQLLEDKKGNIKEEKNCVLQSDEKAKVELDDTDNKAFGDDFQISDAAGIELLSNKEIDLCKRLSLLPKFYLEAKKELIQKSFEAGILNVNDPKQNVLVKIDVEKRDGVIDFVMKSGWIPTKPRKTG